MSSSFTISHLAKRITAHVIKKMQDSSNKEVKSDKISVLIQGITSEENSGGITNSKAGKFTAHLSKYFPHLIVEDPYAKSVDVWNTFGVTMVKKAEGTFDVIILAVSHTEFKKKKTLSYENIIHKHTLFFDVSPILKHRMKSGACQSPTLCEVHQPKPEDFSGFEHHIKGEVRSEVPHLMSVKKREGNPDSNEYKRPLNLSGTPGINELNTPLIEDSNLATSSLVQPEKATSVCLTLDDLTFLKVHTASELTNRDVLNSDGLLIHADTEDEARAILQWVRSHSVKEIVLKPVLIDADSMSLTNIRFMFDDVYDPVNKSMIYQKVKGILNRVKEFQNVVHEIDYDRFFMQITLQFMYSREISLEPVLYRKATLGYAYAFIFSAIRQGDEMNAITVLNKMIEYGFLRRTVHEKVHSCVKCEGGYLHYRECCPNCGSADLNTSDLIHHFVCAHVGPEEDYVSGDELVCPKCDKVLRH
ncbi:MAG: UDP binding domain-containing protein, partial [Bacteroidota bacterium]